MDQQRIEELAPRLGSELANRIDVEATTQRVLDRLNVPAGTEGTRWFKEFRVLRVAAAVVMVFGSSILLWSGSHRTVGEGSEWVSGLDGLGSTDLVEVLDSLEAEAPVAELVNVELQDLDESELTELLAMMEG